MHEVQYYMRCIQGVSTFVLLSSTNNYASEIGRLGVSCTFHDYKEPRTP